MAEVSVELSGSHFMELVPINGSLAREIYAVVEREIYAVVEYESDPDLRDTEQVPLHP